MAQTQRAPTTRKSPKAINLNRRRRRSHYDRRDKRRDIVAGGHRAHRFTYVVRKHEYSDGGLERRKDGEGTLHQHAGQQQPAIPVQPLQQSWGQHVSRTELLRKHADNYPAVDVTRVHD